MTAAPQGHVAVLQLLLKNWIGDTGEEPSVTAGADALEAAIAALQAPGEAVEVTAEMARRLKDSLPLGCAGYLTVQNCRVAMEAALGDLIYAALPAARGDGWLIDRGFRVEKGNVHLPTVTVGFSTFDERDRYATPQSAAQTAPVSAGEAEDDKFHARLFGMKFRLYLDPYSLADNNEVELTLGMTSRREAGETAFLHATDHSKLYTHPMPASAVDGREGAEAGGFVPFGWRYRWGERQWRVSVGQPRAALPIANKQIQRLYIRAPHMESETVIDDDDGLLVEGDADDMAEALAEISADLGCDNTLDDMLHAIDALRVAPVAASLEWSNTLCNGERVTHKKAEKACAALGEGWRLPTRVELLSLVDDTRADPAIDTERFPDTKSAAYWTSTPFASDSSYAWFVSFYDGYANDLRRDYDDAFVRAVRSVPAGQ